MTFDRIHYEWAASVLNPEKESPRDFDEYQDAVRLVLNLLEENTKFRAALTFYADPKNWADTPSWDGDPDCITEKAIPMFYELDGARLCDCGDIAREALK